MNEAEGRFVSCWVDYIISKGKLSFVQWVFSSVKELLQTALNIYESASNYLKIRRLLRNDVGVKRCFGRIIL